MTGEVQRRRLVERRPGQAEVVVVVVLKQATPVAAAREIAVLQRWYEREAKFYKQLAPALHDGNDGNGGGKDDDTTQLVRHYG